jgi:RNA polymerase sigma-70 factor (sigma-E family)
MTTDTSPPTLEGLFHDQRLPMVRLALLLVDDLASAEDVVQDAFAGLVKAWDRLDSESALRAYLRTSVVNASRSMLRRRRTARNYVPPLRPDEPGADEAVVLSEEHAAVIVALGTLSPRQREVLVLRHWSGLSEAEVAETLGISTGTVKSTASRGLTALRAAMSGRDS